MLHWFAAEIVVNRAIGLRWRGGRLKRRQSYREQANAIQQLTRWTIDCLNSFAISAKRSRGYRRFLFVICSRYPERPINRYVCTDCSSRRPIVASRICKKWKLNWYQLACTCEGLRVAAVSATLMRLYPRKNYVLRSVSLLSQLDGIFSVINEATYDVKHIEPSTPEERH